MMTTISGHPTHLGELEQLVADARRLGAFDVASVGTEEGGRVCITFAAGGEGDLDKQAGLDRGLAVTP